MFKYLAMRIVKYDLKSIYWRRGRCAKKQTNIYARFFLSLRTRAAPTTTVIATAAAAIAVKGLPTTVARTTRVQNVEEVTFGQLKNTSIYIIHNGCRVYTVKIIIYIVVVVSTETGIDYDDGSLTTTQTH